MAVAGFFLTGVAIPVYDINQFSVRQAVIPLDMQGRGNATMRTIIRGSVPLGAVVGGLLMVGNAALLCALGRRAGAAIAARRAQLATGAGNGVLVLLLLLFNLKLLILAVLIYLCIRLLPIDPLAFLFGLSTLPAAILARAVQHGFSGKVEPSEPTSTLVAESDRLAKD